MAGDGAPAHMSWLTLGAASALLGVSESTIRRWADAGEIRSYRTSGGHRRVLEEDLRQIVSNTGAPSRDSRGWMEARLDFEVGVPENLPVVVRDGSGEARIENVASAEIVDGSGELEIRGIRGNLEVTDGSGQIDIRDVGGNVTIDDGSGSIEVSHVGGSVIVRVDGSGGIDVDDVKGDFIVERDGSGGVDFQRVKGKVSIPRD